MANLRWVSGELTLIRIVEAPKTLFLFSVSVGKYNFFRDVDLAALVLAIMPNHGLGDFLQIACKILKWEACFYCL